MPIRTIDAVCVTSTSKKRQQIRIDSNSGLILEVGDNILPHKDIDFYYDDTCLLFPIFGDVHVHAREDVTKKQNYKEEMKTVSQAALNGGVGFVCDMPNNPCPPINDSRYLEKFKISINPNHIPILPYAGIGPGTKPLSFLVPYKAYMGPSVGELFFQNNQQLRNTLKEYKGRYVSFHCEDPCLLTQLKDEKTHIEKRPRKAELIATDEAINCIKEFNLQGKLCHFSVGHGLEYVNKAKQEQVHVQCEVTPQHLFYSQEKVLQEEQLGPSFLNLLQMNPPIRFEEDRMIMLEAFRNGEIDYLATDHAPHTWQEKLEGTSGLPGLDTFGLFITWLLSVGKISAQKIAQTCSENPARFFNTFYQSFKDEDKISNLLKNSSFDNLGEGFGSFKVGYSASFTILNLSKKTTLTKMDLKTKVNWSPFEGVEFPGSVEQVFLKGQPTK